MKSQTVTYILQTGGYYGNWAKGSSIKEAALNLHKAGAKKSERVAMLVMMDDPKAYIDSSGGINFGGSEAPDAWYTDMEWIGLLSQLVK